MSVGLPVLQRLDKANPGQVTEGVNGYVFRTAEEFSAILLRFRSSCQAVRPVCTPQLLIPSKSCIPPDWQDKWKQYPMKGCRNFIPA